MSSPDVTIAVGQIAVTLRKEPAEATIACGHYVPLDGHLARRTIATVGTAAGTRFVAELAKIREALQAAQRVLAHDGGGAATADHVTLGRLLVELEISP